MKKFQSPIVHSVHRTRRSLEKRSAALAFAGLSLLLLVFGAAPGYPASGAEPKVKLDVPYEPSSDEVVEVMLDLAQVGPNDLVYDLGCGDGRIVIAAARKTGARGVGVDLDPQRIKESLENARKANLGDRVEFREQDLFQTDIRRATVVMLYLYPEVNLKLRPKLFRELNPGTRVVSHSHDMGRWEPDRSVTAPGGHRIYFWVIPANVGGTWECSLPGTKERGVLKLTQRFQKAFGTLAVGSREFPLKDVELRGDRLQFAVELPLGGGSRTTRFMGRVDGNGMEGTESTGSAEKQAWKAIRDSSSVKPLEVE